MQLAVQFVDGVAHPQAQVGGHLIVARAAGVEFPRERPHFLVQQPLHQGVHVLVGRAHRGTIGEAFADPLQSRQQRSLLVGRQHVGQAQGHHPHPGDADVLGPQSAVDGETAVELEQRLTGVAAEATTPHLVQRRAFGADGVERRAGA